MANDVKITGSKRPTIFGELNAGDLFFYGEPNCITICIRLENGRNAVDLRTGVEISFKNSHEIYRIVSPQGVHLRVEI